MNIAKWKRRLPLLLVLTFSAFTYFMFADYFTLEALQNNKEQIFDFKNSMPLISALVFTVLYAFATALSLPFGTVLAILGGYLFGTFLGLFIVTVGATIGATAIFMISKYSLKGTIPKHLSGIYKKAKNNFEENEVSYLLFLRLVPLFPFAMVNILPALFNVPLRTYVLTTFFGIIPGTLVHTFLGSAFEEINSLSGLVSPKTLSAFAALGLLSLVPILLKKCKKKKAV